jgi:hypothetical protein
MRALPRQTRMVNPIALHQFKVRLRAGLRNRLIEAARKNGTNLTHEVADRLERSFQADAMRSIEEVAADLRKAASRIGKQTEPAE